MADLERELDWDSEIEKDSDFILLPEGDYDFTVTSFERARHAGSENLPPCNKAIISLTINAPEETAIIKHNLFLHSKCEGLLSAFFCSIGQKKHGEKLKMDWNSVIGKKGRCKITVRKWINKDGEEIPINDIKRFYDPPEQPSQTSVSTTPASPSGVYTPGKF